ncbi:MAG: trigger factor [Lachnospiraceae bacterium]|nr:trigger factor [Lachnospiraceae bacterium]
MSVQVEKLEGSMAKLTIEVSAEDFEKAIEKAYHKQKNQIVIPGFRKGKAPRAVIEKMYGKEVFYEEAINEAVPEAYEKAYDECGEDIVSSPKIEIVKAEAGENLVFTAEVALKPPVTLGEYKGIEIDKVETAVSDEEVEEKIKKNLDLQARYETVTDRAVQDGDQVILDFEGFVDGVAFEGGKGTNYSLGIGSGQFIPGFEEQLVGAELEKELDVNVTFPEDYQEETLAGKAAVFKCTVHEIKQKLVPELDDDFAGDAGFDTVAAYRENVRAELETAKVSEANSAKQDAVLDKVIEHATLEIPEAMLETEKRSMLNDYAQRLQSQGLRFDQYLQYTGMTREKMMEQMTPQAESRIRSRLVLEAIAEKENITVSDEDLDSELKTMAEAYALEADKVKEMLGEEGIKQVTDDVRIKKALEFITDAAVEK